MRNFSLVALILAACTTGSGDTTDDSNDSNDSNETDDVFDGDCDVDGALDGDAAAYEAWGISGDDPDCEALDIDGCTDPVVIEAATRFWIGELVFDADGNVSGYEAKVIYANEAWKETAPNEGYDCLIVFNVSTGSKTAAPAPFDYEITLAATLDVGRSTCTPGLTNAEGPYTTTYRVGLAGDGAATVYFDSGNEFATGSGSDGCLQYVSDGACEIYGSGECN